MPHGTRGKLNAVAGGTTSVKVWVPVPTVIELGIGMIVCPPKLKRMFALPSGPTPGFCTSTVIVPPGMIGLLTEVMTGLTGRKENVP